MIQGAKVRNPTKRELATEIAEELGIGAPDVSAGSSVDSKFLDEIHKARGHLDSAGPVAYRKAERVLQDLALTYDANWDTSESQEKGGSTVTNRAYSRIRSALTGIPRCFILNTTDAPVGARWETEHRRIYRYDRSVTAHRPLNDAGPGSRVIFYSTSKSTQKPKHFVATAEIRYIDPGWTGPWEALIADYTEFASPVPGSELHMEGWNHQHAITEITWETYQALLVAGRLPRPTPGAENPDPGAEITARRVLNEVPLPTQAPTLVVPSALPGGVISLAKPTVPTYVEVDDKTVVTSDLPPWSSNVEKNRLAEQRSVALTKQALEARGWTLTRDCQKDGIGYDLRFAKGSRVLHVEVKAIQSSTLAFNLTPKESWRLETDPAFVVVAVTSVLSPAAFNLNLLTRDQIAAGKRVVTGYRITL